MCVRRAVYFVYIFCYFVIYAFMLLCSIEEAILHGITVRTQYQMKDISQALPLSMSPNYQAQSCPSSYRNTEDKDSLNAASTSKGDEDADILPPFLPLAVVEHGASYCNRVDKLGRPIVYLKLGQLEAYHRARNVNISGDGAASYVYTDDDYLYSMLHTLER